MKLTQFNVTRHDTLAVLPYARVTVLIAGTATKASLFDATGAPILNPMEANDIGLVSFRVVDGTYDIWATSRDGMYTVPVISSLQIVDLVNVVGTITSGRVARPTWSELSVLTSSAGLVAEVPSADTGTHTDPVSGLTVPNAGVYRWSASPAGWLRMYDAPDKLATDQVTLAVTARSGAETARTASEAARDAAIASNIGQQIYQTKAAATAAVAGIPANAYVRVLADESQSGSPDWIYQKVSGSLVSVKSFISAVQSGSYVVAPPALVGGAAATTLLSLHPATGTQTGGTVYGNMNMAATSQIIRSTGIHYDDNINRIYNSVINIAQNTNGSVSLKFNPAMPITRMAMETSYAQTPGGVLICEFHPVSVIGQINAPGPSTETRLVSWVAPHDYNLNSTEIAGSFRARVIDFLSGVGDQVIKVSMPSGSGRVMDFFAVGGDAMQIRFGQNGRAPITALNAAGNAYLELYGRLSSSNRLNNDMPRTERITLVNGELGGGNTGVETSFSGVVAGNTLRYNIWNSVTGALTADSWSGGATGLLSFQRRNQSSGGGLATIMTINSGSVGICFQNQTLGLAGPQMVYSHARDALELQADGYQLGAATTAGISIARTTGVVSMPNGALPGLKTVGTLPTPTTGDKGRTFYCTNARNAGEGAAAGTGSLVACNGTAYTIPGNAGAVAA